MTSMAGINIGCGDTHYGIHTFNQVTEWLIGNKEHATGSGWVSMR